MYMSGQGICSRGHDATKTTYAYHGIDVIKKKKKPDHGFWQRARCSGLAASAHPQPLPLFRQRAGAKRYKKKKNTSFYKCICTRDACMSSNMYLSACMHMHTHKSIRRLVQCPKLHQGARTEKWMQVHAGNAMGCICVCKPMHTNE